MISFPLAQAADWTIQINNCFNSFFCGKGCFLRSLEMFSENAVRQTRSARITREMFVRGKSDDWPANDWRLSRNKWGSSRWPLRRCPLCTWWPTFGGDGRLEKNWAEAANVSSVFLLQFIQFNVTFSWRHTSQKAAESPKSCFSNIRVLLIGARSIAPHIKSWEQSSKTLLLLLRFFVYEWLQSKQIDYCRMNLGNGKIVPSDKIKQILTLLIASPFRCCHFQVCRFFVVCNRMT